MKEIIEQTLRRLGITRNYRGYNILLVAVRLVVEDESRIRNVMQEVYKPVSEELNCGYSTIERNIRTIIRRVWDTNADALQRIATYHMAYYPPTAEFIDIIANHVQKVCRTNVHK
ncbi:MAG: sporulation initiation factor Spo0A C-terminal domain-containing protein [Clostridia bacterium]|nr:sporulation initiation factor Spo0A C-terminal domain-containing protein [Clostridia bacterium]